MSKTKTSKYMQSLKNGDEAAELKLEAASIDAIKQIEQAISETKGSIQLAENQKKSRVIQIKQARLASDPYNLQNIMRLSQGVDKFDSTDITRAGDDQLSQYITVLEKRLTLLEDILTDHIPT